MKTAISIDYSLGEVFTILREHARENSDYALKNLKDGGQTFVENANNPDDAFVRFTFNER